MSKSTCVLHGVEQAGDDEEEVYSVNAGVERGEVEGEPDGNMEGREDQMKPPRKGLLR